MSKLLKFKKWINLDVASKHLTEKCNENITILDIIQLALDKHIFLSVKFPYGCSIAIREWDKQKILYSEILKREFDLLYKDKEINISEMDFITQRYNKILEKIEDKEQFTLDYFLNDFYEEYECGVGPIYWVDDHDIYDLPLIGNERYYIENIYSNIVGIPYYPKAKQYSFIFSKNILYCILESQGEDKNKRSLNPKNFSEQVLYFPENSEIVIRTEELQYLESMLLNKKDTRPSSKTTNLQAKFIKALIQANYGRHVAENVRWHIDTEKNETNQIGEIRKHFQKCGLNNSIPSGFTVERWIKDIELDIDE